MPLDVACKYVGNVLLYLQRKIVTYPIKIKNLYRFFTRLICATSRTGKLQCFQLIRDLAFKLKRFAFAEVRT